MNTNTYLHELLDAAVGHTPPPDHDLDGCAEDLPGKVLHVPREGRGEEDGLAVGARVAKDARDLWFEALETQCEDVRLQCVCVCVCVNMFISQSTESTGTHISRH